MMLPQIDFPKVTHHNKTVWRRHRERENRLIRQGYMKIKLTAFLFEDSSVLKKSLKMEPKNLAGKLSVALVFLSLFLRQKENQIFQRNPMKMMMSI